MSISFAPDSTNKSIDIRVYDDDGLPVTGLVAATMPTIKYSLAGANADVTISLIDLATITTAWISGGVKERGEGAYRLDLPNATLTTAGIGTLRGEATGKRVVCEAIEINTETLLSEDVPADYAQGSVGWALGRIGLGKITVNSPVLPDGSVSIVQRGSYKTRFGNALDWTDTDADLSWPTLTGAEIRLQVGDGLLDIVGEVITGTGSPKRVRAQLSSTTTDLAPGVYPMVLKAFFTGTGTDDDEYPLAVGSFTVLDGEAD